MDYLFFSTLYKYSLSILPWFSIGIVLAFLIERSIRPNLLKRYFKSTSIPRVFVALILGMLSPLSIMSFLPIANQIVASGAAAGIIFSFFVAERAYDLQSFLIISSLFGVRFALLNALAIFISLFVSALVIRHEKVKFAKKKDGTQNDFWRRQVKLLVIVLFGILVGAVLRVTIPVAEFSSYTGNPLSGIGAGSLLGFLLYFGPILGNYPVAKSFLELGMAPGGVFAFLTVSPIINIVVILLFGAAVGYKSTYKAFLAYGVTSLFLTFIFTPFL